MKESVLYVDSRAGAMEESGDVILSGVSSWVFVIKVKGRTRGHLQQQCSFWQFFIFPEEQCELKEI